MEIPGHFSVAINSERMVGPEQARVNFAVLAISLMGRDPLEGRGASSGKVLLKFEHGDDEAALLERRGVE